MPAPDFGNADRQVDQLPTHLAKLHRRIQAAHRKQREASRKQRSDVDELGRRWPGLVNPPNQRNR